jgi:integrase
MNTAAENKEAIAVRELRDMLQDDIISFESDAEIKNMKDLCAKNLEKLIMKKYRGKICITARGLYKTHNPQFTAKTKDGLLWKLYDFYFGEGNFSFCDVYDIWHSIRTSDPDIAYRTTKREQGYYIKYIVNNPIGSYPISAITSPMLAQYFKDISAGRKMTRKNFNNIKTIFNLVFDYAVEKGLVSNGNVSRDVSTRSYKFKIPNSKRKAYTSEERKKILDVTWVSGSQYARIVELIFCLGCRASEVEALRWEDIDFENRTICIHRMITEVDSDDGTGERKEVQYTKMGLDEGIHTLPISDLALESLKRQKRRGYSKTYVFKNEDGSYISTSTLDCGKRDLNRI